MPFNFDEYRAECAGYDDWHLQKEFEKYTRMMASSSAGTGMAVALAPFSFGLSYVLLGGAPSGAADVNAVKKKRIIEQELNWRSNSARLRGQEVRGPRRGRGSEAAFNPSEAMDIRASKALNNRDSSSDINMPFDFDEYRAECAGYDDWHLQKEFEKYTRMMALSSAGTGIAVALAPFTVGLSLLGGVPSGAAYVNAVKKKRIIEQELNWRSNSARLQGREIHGPRRGRGSEAAFNPREAMDIRASKKALNNRDSSAPAALSRNKILGPANDKIAAGTISLAAAALDVETTAKFDKDGSIQDADDGGKHLVNQSVKEKQISTDAPREKRIVLPADSVEYGHPNVDNTVTKSAATKTEDSSHNIVPHLQESSQVNESTETKSHDRIEISRSVMTSELQLHTAQSARSANSLPQLSLSEKLAMALRDEGASEAKKVKIVNAKISENIKTIPRKSRAITGSFKLDMIPRWLSLKFRPKLKDGYQRITWKCGCGDNMYADVKETYLGGGQKLEARLRMCAISAGNKHADSFTSTISDTGSSRSSHQSTSDSETQEDSSSSISSGRQEIDITENNIESTPSRAPVKKYVLLCINTWNRIHLEQIDVTYAGDDQVLFNSIRQAYSDIRKSHYIPLPTILTSVIGDVSLSRPEMGRFVKFVLVPQRMHVNAIITKQPSLPPMEEVKTKKRYHYSPCPPVIDDPFLSIQFFHEYFKPGKHFDDFWLEQIPKKLWQKLEYGKGGECSGWGIHIVEGPHWAVLSVVAVMGILVALVSMAVYVGKTGDVSGGMGLGALVVALQAAVFPMVFFRWQYR